MTYHSQNTSGFAQTRTVQFCQELETMRSRSNVMQELCGMYSIPHSSCKSPATCDTAGVEQPFPHQSPTLPPFSLSNPQHTAHPNLASRAEHIIFKQFINSPTQKWMYRVDEHDKIIKLNEHKIICNANDGFSATTECEGRCMFSSLPDDFGRIYSLCLVSGCVYQRLVGSSEGDSGPNSYDMLHIKEHLSDSKVLPYHEAQVYSSSTSILPLQSTGNVERKAHNWREMNFGFNIPPGVDYTHSFNGETYLPKPGPKKTKLFHPLFRFPTPTHDIKEQVKKFAVTNDAAYFPPHSNGNNGVWPTLELEPHPPYSEILDESAPSIEVDLDLEGMGYDASNEQPQKEGLPRLQPGLRNILCPVMDCPRSQPNNGFSRNDNLTVHRRNVHGELVPRMRKYKYPYTPGSSNSGGRGVMVQKVSTTIRARRRKKEKKSQ